MMRKCWSILCLCAMLMSMLSMAVPTLVWADTDGDYEYTVLADGTAEISGYYGSVNTLTVPSSLGGYVVTSIGNYAFSYCPSLTSVTIPGDVTSVGDYAFYSCKSLTSVTILHGVTSIGNYAFSWCPSLIRVTIPDSVTDIVNGVFYNCPSLTNVTIPCGVKNIGEDVFLECDALQTIQVAQNNTAYCDVDGVLFTKDRATLVRYPTGKQEYSYTIPDGVKSIGAGAFSDCESLSNVTIPQGVTSIEDSAFYKCKFLSSVTIPDSVTSIGDSVFYECASLGSITPGNGVTSIGQDAFYNTAYSNNSNYWESRVLYIGNWLVSAGTMLDAKYVIKSGTTVIANNAFSMSDSLTSVTIPDSVKSIGEDVFFMCSSLQTIGVAKNNPVYCDVSGVLFTKDRSTLLRYPEGKPTSTYTIPNSVTSIGDGAFDECDSLQSVTIPDSVTSIGGGAFDGCDSLQSVTIPDSVTSIGDGAFSKCDSLQTIKVAQNNAYCDIDGVLFTKDRATLVQYPTGKRGSSYTVPNSVKSIGAGAFSNCESLTNVTIPNSVTSIEEYAFNWCESLTSVTMSNRVTSIGNHAFSYCRSLTSVTIPDSVTSMGWNVFSGCDSLTSVTIPDGVESIPYMTFFYCESLTSVTIPDSVKIIEGDAFSGCYSLTSVTIPDGVRNIGGYAFSGCVALTSVTIPDSVTGVNNGTFYNCDSLTSVTIPNRVTSIGNSAFYRCNSLTSVTIPDSVTSIGYEAFDWCDLLKDVYYAGAEASWEEIAIADDNAPLTSARIHYRVTDPQFHWEFFYMVYEPTCTEVGEGRYSCICNHSKYVWLPAKGHNKHNVVIKEATCTEEGYTEYFCTGCNETITENRVLPTGHLFPDWECVHCGGSVESSHPYEDSCDETFIIYRAGAVSLQVTFSQETDMESGWDFIYLYDGDGRELGVYTGAELSGQTVMVYGDTMRIHLTSDESNAYYGFAVTDIVANFPTTYPSTTGPTTPTTYPSTTGPTTSTTTPTVNTGGVPGDWDGNGNINMMDALNMFSLVSAGEFPQGREEQMDMNGDGVVNMMDCLLVFRMASGQI